MGNKMCVFGSRNLIFFLILNFLAILLWIYVDMYHFIYRNYSSLDDSHFLLRGNEIRAQNIFEHSKITQTNYRIYECMFFSCKAQNDKDGGAILLEKNCLSVEKSVFLLNYAENSGGAITSRFCHQVIIESSAFSHNSASFAAGSYLSFLTFDLLIDKCNFSSDFAPKKSSSLAVLSCDQSKLHNLVYYNSSSNDGAVLSLDTGMVNISFNRFHRSPSCFYIESWGLSSTVVSNSIFGNHDVYSIVSQRDALIILSDSDFYRDKGAEIFEADGSIISKDNCRYNSQYGDMIPDRVSTPLLRTEIPPTVIPTRTKKNPTINLVNPFVSDHISTQISKTAEVLNPTPYETAESIRPVLVLPTAIKKNKKKLNIGVIFGWVTGLFVIVISIYLFMTRSAPKNPKPDQMQRERLISKKAISGDDEETLFQ